MRAAAPVHGIIIREDAATESGSICAASLQISGVEGEHAIADRTAGPESAASSGSEVDAILESLAGETVRDRKANQVTAIQVNSSDRVVA